MEIGLLDITSLLAVSQEIGCKPPIKLEGSLYNTSLFYS